MASDPRRTWAAWLLAGIAVGTAGVARPTVAAGQTTATTAAPLTERLKAVQADLFSSNAHLEDDIKALNSILAIEPSSADAHMLLGIAYRGLGSESVNMMGEAKAEFRQALALNPALVSARLFLAQLYLDLGRSEQARDEMLTALAQAPGQPQLLAVLGEAERQAGDPAGALRAAQQALQANPGFIQARYYLALALLDLKRRDEAIQQLEQVAATNPNVADLYLTLGTVYLEAGRVADAVRVLNQGTRIGPQRTDLRVALARAYRTQGALDNAEAQLTLAEASNTAQATSAYQRTSASLSLEWGLIRLQQGRLEEAATAFEKAIDIDPDDGQAHRALAEVRLRQGSYAQAREEADRAQRLGAPLPDAMRRTLDEKAPASSRGAGR